MILLIDNYDSFVHNLGRYFQELGQSIKVVRNDAMTVAEIVRSQPAAVVLSPGPCTPQESGVCLELLQMLLDSATAIPRLPVLGVCLGHQAIAAAANARVIRAPEPVHGRADWISHSGQGLFAGIPSPLRVGRYHSLTVEESTLPASDWRITARTQDRIVMALQHAHLPIYGVQFHPESILTEHGHHLLRNFLTLANIDSTQPALVEAPYIEDVPPDWDADDFFQRPIVFPPQ